MKWIVVFNMLSRSSSSRLVAVGVVVAVVVVVAGVVVVVAVVAD